MKLLTIFSILCLCSAANGLGQEKVCYSPDDCRKVLETNPRSSAAHFLMAELFLAKTDYMSAANEFRSALDGNLEPKWTEAWSHVNLGKIFDAAGQRERAINEYRMALKSKDNTRGALDEAKRYLESPYKRK